MNQDNWTHDWARFVESVIASHDAGADEEALSRQFGNHQVRWRGTVVSVDLEVEFSPSVVVSMGKETSTLANGYEFFSDHLAVAVEASGRETWRDVRPGSEVAFRCDLRVSNGPFAGIKVSAFEQEREAYLEVSTANGVCLRV